MRYLVAAALITSTSLGCGGGPSGAEDSAYPGAIEPLDELGEGATGADALALAARARVWRTNVSLAACGSTSVEEDFSSGRYNAHRWAATLPAGGSTEVVLTRARGTWQPAIVVALADGTFVTDGEAIAAAGLTVAASAPGRSGSAARLTLSAQRTTSVAIYATSWGAVDSDYSASITTGAEYVLRLSHTCPPAPGRGWASLHRGLDLSGSRIPRAGLANATLRSSLGVAVEPYGTVVSFEGAAFVRGTTSHFGGPNDTGVTTSETGAISGDRLRALNNPLNPSASTLASRPADYFYVAMRFDYSPGGRTFWQTARLLVINPANGRAVVVRPVDWGPHTRTRRVLDLSPQAMTSLGLTTDQPALVAFAAPGTPLGLVQ